MRDAHSVVDRFILRAIHTFSYYHFDSCACDHLFNSYTSAAPFPMQVQRGILACKLIELKKNSKERTWRSREYHNATPMASITCSQRKSDWMRAAGCAWRK
jgi:hypothetical protein